MTKKSNNKKSSGIVYEQVARNIQKQFRTSTGTTKYRVRIGTPDGEVSSYATSLKKAYALRKELMA